MIIAAVLLLGITALLLLPGGVKDTENIKVSESGQKDTENTKVTESKQAAQDAAADVEDVMQSDKKTGSAKASEGAKTSGTVNIAEEAEVSDSAENSENEKSTLTYSDDSEAFIFETVTLDGEKVDQDIFSDYDLTVVHLWGTFCPPCIKEMGEYARFYDDLPEGVNLVGIICDVYKGYEDNVHAAHDILDDAGAKFTNLRTSESIYNVTSYFQFVPSSFFVDRNGHIIGQMLDGASFDDTMSFLEEYSK